jgi:hypothetical protein
LREAVSAGDIAPLDVPRATQALLAYFQGAMLLAKTANDADVIEQLGERAVWLVGGVATSTPEAISERTTING